MMKKILTLLSAALLLPMVCGAAIPDIKFRRLDTRDGLSNSQILSVKRDSKGLVWIGTPYGFNRYDGYRVKTFYTEMRDSTTLRSNYVDDIFEDGEGRLWLKQSMSYTIFDPVTESCDRHPERLLEEWGITGGLEYLYIDSKNEFWIKTYNEGFVHYVPKTKQLKRFKYGYGAQDFTPNIGINGITELGDTLLINSSLGEVIAFSRQKNAIIDKDSYLAKNIITSEQDIKPRFDHLGNLWLISYNGTHVRDKKTKQWNHSLNNYLQSVGLPLLPKDDIIVWDMMTDNRNRLWVATDHDGLIIIDSEDKEIRQFMPDKYDESTISDNTVRKLYQDQLGRVWVGTYMNGMNLFAGNTSNFRNLELGVVNTVCYDKQGYSWLGTNDEGIIRYDNRTGEKIVYNKENSGIGSNTMVGSLAASDGSVWFGTYGGGLIHIKNGHVTNYRATSDTTGLANNNVWTVCEDQWGNIWIGTLGSGVQRIDKRTGKWSTIRMSNSILPSDYISTITRTKKGWLMVAHSQYYSLINPKTFRVINRKLTDEQKDLGCIEMAITGMEDSRGLAWIGTTSGASVWDPKSGQAYLIDMKWGLFGSTVNGITEDSRHTMWLVTDHGISNVIVQKDDNGRFSFIVRSYNDRDGLQVGPYNQRSICYTPLHLLLVGGRGGLDVLNPKRLSDGRVKELPIFSGLEVNDRLVDVGEKVNGRVVLKEALNYCRKLSLSYRDQFTVQLASTSGEIHNRSRFVYKLDGVNEDWVKTSEQNPNITFMSLHYGDYTLRVRMLNDDGTIGANEATLDIHIAAPFWRARWAMLLYVLLVLAAAWLWRRYFLRRQKERAEAEELSRELQKQQWMSQMRLQMEKEGLLIKTKRPEPEKLSFKPIYNELVGFVKQTVENFRPATGNRQIKMSFFTSLNRLTIPFDAALLARVFDILLTNTSKFAPSGSRVKVRVDKEGNQAVIRVADRGIGIPEAVREHIFDEDIDSGVNFGVIKRIAELHGGTVAIEDNPGGGTIFIIRLPDSNKPKDDDIPVEDAVLMDD